jgi:hypothetical protein
MVDDLGDDRVIARSRAITQAPDRQSPETTALARLRPVVVRISAR